MLETETFTSYISWNSFLPFLKTDAYSTRKKGKDDKASLRPPSYTDRILCHSQPESRSLLKIERYDMCDAITASDHRPVSAAIDITVLEPCKETIDNLDDEDSSGTLTAAASALHQSARLMKIRLDNIQLKWREASLPYDVQQVSSRKSYLDSPRPGSESELMPSGSSNKSSASDFFWTRSSNLNMDLSFRTKSENRSSANSEKAHTCIAYFPLQNEDPISDLRKGVLMNQALNGQELTAKHMQYIHSFKLSSLKDGVLEFKSLACTDTAR